MGTRQAATLAVVLFLVQGLGFPQTYPVPAKELSMSELLGNGDSNVRDATVTFVSETEIALLVCFTQQASCRLVRVGWDERNLRPLTRVAIPWAPFGELHLLSGGYLLLTSDRSHLLLARDLSVVRDVPIRVLVAP